MEEKRKEVTFNMAIATLARLDSILKRMELASVYVSGIPEQRTQIKLLKYFFLNATPLMSTTQHKKYKKEILEMKISSKTFKGRTVEFEDPKLEKRIFEIAMDIEMELKEHFMPTKNEDDDYDL